MTADATRAAITDLSRQYPEHFYVFALLTTGEGLPPHLAACSVEGDARSGVGRWSLPDSPFAVWGHEKHFAEATRAFNGRGDLHDLSAEAADIEYVTRLASIEEALRLLNVEGFFGTGQERDQVLLLTGTLPPGADDAGFVRRLNPPNPLRSEWLREMSEQVRSAPIPSRPRSSPPTVGHSPLHPTPRWRACGEPPPVCTCRTARRSTDRIPSPSATRPTRSHGTEEDAQFVTDDLVGWVVRQAGVGQRR